MSSPKLRTQAIRVLVAIAALSFAGACGSDGDVTDPGGNLGSSFNATVTGGSAGSYSGFSSVVQAAGLFSIGLSTTDGKFALAFTRSGTRPAAGTYQLGSNPLVGFTGTLTVGGGASGTSSIVYSSSSGTLTITESSSSGIKGAFSFTGAASSGTGAAANISGSFAAVCC